MLLGGIAAETVVYGSYCDGAGGAPTSDLAVASDVATMIECHFGWGESLVVELGNGDRPLEGLRAGDVELRRLVDARLRVQLRRVTSILTDHRGELENLVDLLLNKGRVEGDEVRALVHRPKRATETLAP